MQPSGLDFQLQLQSSGGGQLHLQFSEWAGYRLLILMLIPSSHKILLYLPFYLPNNCFHFRMLGPHLCGCSDALHIFSPWDFWVLGWSEQLEAKVPSMALRVCVPLGVQACLLVHRSLQIFPELWFFSLLVSGPFLILEDYQGLHRVFIML